jgi:hypothetical protein
VTPNQEDIHQTFEGLRDFLLQPAEEQEGLTYGALLRKYYSGLKVQSGVEEPRSDPRDSQRRSGVSRQRNARAREINLNPEPPRI